MKKPIIFINKGQENEEGIYKCGSMQLVDVLHSEFNSLFG
jgi:hypothetical protein